MMEYIVRLTRPGHSEATFPAAVLFEALCRGILDIYGEGRLSTVLDEFMSTPPFLVSAACPWRKATSDVVHDLPRPFFPPLAVKELPAEAVEKPTVWAPYHTEKAKIVALVGAYERFRQWQWVPLDLFRRVLEDGSEEELFREFLWSHQNRLCFADGRARKMGKGFSLAFAAGVSGTEVGRAPSVPGELGSYFLLKTADSVDYLRPVLAQMEDPASSIYNGAGGQPFQVEIEAGPLLGDTSGEAFISLSEFRGGDAIDFTLSSYELISALDNPERPVMLFAAGSILKPLDKKTYYGGLVPLKGMASRVPYVYAYAYPVWIDVPGRQPKKESLFS